MKRIFLSSIFLLFVFISNSFSQESIRIVTGEYPPYLSKHLKYNGVGLRIIKESFALEGIKVEYSFVPWARAFRFVKNGKFDAEKWLATIKQLQSSPDQAIILVCQSGRRSGRVGHYLTDKP